MEIDSSTGKTKSGEDPQYFKKADGSEDLDLNSTTSTSTDPLEKGTGSSFTVSSSTSHDDQASTSHGASNQSTLNTAKRFLQTTAFSHGGLVEQLEFEGFTNQQAAHGTGSV